MQHPLGTSLDQDKVWQIFTCPAQILVSGNSKKEKVAMELNSLPFMVDRPDYFKLAGNGQDGVASIHCLHPTLLEIPCCTVQRTGVVQVTSNIGLKRLHVHTWPLSYNTNSWRLR